MSLPFECSFRPTIEDLDAFKARKKTPDLGISGSGWGLKQLKHCHVDFRSDLEAFQLLKFQNLVPENSFMAEYLQRNLSNDWQGILRSCADDHAQQLLSSLDYGLGKLASLPLSEYSYHSSSSLEVQSSPLVNQSHFNTSPEQQRKTQRAAEYAQTPTSSPGSLMRTSPLGLSSSPLAEYSPSIISPAQRLGTGDVSVHQQSPPPSSPPETSHSPASSEMDIDESLSETGYAQGFADFDSQPKLPTHKPGLGQRDLGDEYKYQTSLSNSGLVPYSKPSSSVGHRNSPSTDSNVSIASRYNTGLESVPEENKDETDVEHVARLFIRVVVAGIRTAASLPTGNDPKRWKIKEAYGSKHSKKFEIDGYTIVANPDCTISLRVEHNQKARVREVLLHFEVKKLEHGLARYSILGQELSELLAEAIQMRHRLRKDLDTIPSWLVSWHHLECYFTKLEVTRNYLDQLSDTSGLYKQQPALIRRSRRYNLRSPADRVAVGLMYARIILELLGEYNSNQKLGIVEQLQS